MAYQLTLQMPNPPLQLSVGVKMTSTIFHLGGRLAVYGARFLTELCKCRQNTEGVAQPNYTDAALCKKMGLPTGPISRFATSAVFCP
jgi:hypothetical protein